jgi:hypothetical protein
MRCRFLSPDEFRDAEQARQALAKARDGDYDWKVANSATYGWATLSEIAGPCVMWYVPWYFDPNDATHVLRRETALQSIADGTFGKGDKNYYLSKHYWQDWSDKRPPICVTCPNGREWCVDAKSSNGDGWKVTGDVPNITCHPSIVVPEYHGWLRNGEFVDA